MKPYLVSLALGLLVGVIYATDGTLVRDEATAPNSWSSSERDEVGRAIRPGDLRWSLSVAFSSADLVPGSIEVDDRLEMAPQTEV